MCRKCQVSTLSDLGLKAILSCLAVSRPPAPICQRWNWAVEPGCVLSEIGLSEAKGYCHCSGQPRVTVWRAPTSKRSPYVSSADLFFGGLTESSVCPYWLGSQCRFVWVECGQTPQGRKKEADGRLVPSRSGACPTRNCFFKPTLKLSLLMQPASRNSCPPSPTTAISVLPQLPLRGRANDASPDDGSGHPYTPSWIIRQQTGRARQAKMPLSPPANILSSADSSLLSSAQMQVDYELGCC